MRAIILFLIGCLIFGASCGAGGHSPVNDHARMGHNSNEMPANNSAVNHGNMDHSSMQSSPNAADAAYDLQFLDTMTEHHRAAVDMAKTVDGKAQHAELNTLAKKIIADQEKEIAQMKKWRDEWFAGAQPAVNMSMAGMSDSMKGMDNNLLGRLTGNDLDLEFIKQMIPHHQGAIVMAAEAQRKSQREQLKTLAATIIKEQNAEIEQMQRWQEAWSK